MKQVCVKLKAQLYPLMISTLTDFSHESLEEERINMSSLHNPVGPPLTPFAPFGPPVCDGMTINVYCVHSLERFRVHDASILDGIDWPTSFNEVPEGLSCKSEKSKTHKRIV